MLQRIAVILLALTFGAGAAYALDDEQAAQAAKTRQSVLTVMRWNVVPMAGMVKERMPYDEASFRLYSARLAYMTTMLPDAFRPDTRGNDIETEALDKIWENFDEFERLAGEAKEKADALNAAAMSADFATVQSAFMDVGQSCKNCHDEFREDDD